MDVVFAARAVLFCFFWYLASAGQSIVNKLALQQFPYPLTIALSSCISNTFYTALLIRAFGLATTNIGTVYMLKVVLPIAFGKALAVSSSYFALAKVSISYSQTVKSTLPVFTVVISHFIFKKKSPFRIYISLVPIVFGVFLATVTEWHLDTAGLAMSLFSTFIFAFLNVLVKKVLDDTGMHPVNLLLLNNQLASLILFPVWVGTDSLRMWWTATSQDPQRMILDVGDGSGGVYQQYRVNSQFLIYLLVSGLCSFLQNLFAFMLIGQLTTISYSVASATKRIFVIVLSLMTLRNPVTPLNVYGMLSSILGILIYNMMKNKTPVLKERYSGIGNNDYKNGDSNDVYSARMLRRIGSSDASLNFTT